MVNHISDGTILSLPSVSLEEYIVGSSNISDYVFGYHDLPFLGAPHIEKRHIVVIICNKGGFFVRCCVFLKNAALTLLFWLKSVT